MNNDETIILLTNPKISKIYRVTVFEEREELFKKLMESNGFRFTQIGEHKQAAISISLERMIRHDK